METFDLAHVAAPASGRVHIALVHQPRNAVALLDAVKRGSIIVPCALVDARLITSTEHLLVAVHQAVLREARGTLKTKNVHSEILWNLSTTSNIMESFRTFGLSEKTRDLLVVHVASTSPSEPHDNGSISVLEKMRTMVEGDYDERGPSTVLDMWKSRGTSFDDADTMTDWEAVIKAYKLSDVSLEDDKEPQEGRPESDSRTISRERIDALVTSTVAIKFVAS